MNMRILKTNLDPNASLSVDDIERAKDAIYTLADCFSKITTLSAGLWRYYIARIIKFDFDYDFGITPDVARVTGEFLEEELLDEMEKRNYEHCND